MTKCNSAGTADRSDGEMMIVRAQYFNKRQLSVQETYKIHWTDIWFVPSIGWKWGKIAWLYLFPVLKLISSWEEAALISNP